ncbi:MAG: response regulator transcription factor [Gammaproteobacteria bacterium]|nr:response regulator transcription factor [Gammaproteobacteria bacterium]
MKVLIVEDDRAQRALLTHWMKGEGYRVEALEDGRSLIKSLEAEPADLLILDWNLPDVPGDDLLRWVRGRRHASLPVIFQTVHDREEDIVRILDAGADDYLVKPVQKLTLLARVRAVMRRTQALPDRESLLKVGSVTLIQLSQTLKTHTGSLSPSEKEFAIAWQLATRVGQVILREQLMADVWGFGPNIETRAVDMYVSRLRTKLRQLHADDWQIQSVYGIGYRLELLRDGRSELDTGGGSSNPEPVADK